MNKAAILKTAICYWSKDDSCYLAESPLFDRIVGAGETPAEARRVFVELLDEMYLAYLEGRLAAYPTRGRPSKGYEEFHTKIRPALKAELANMAKELGISQGEVIEYVYRSWQLSRHEGPQTSAR